MRNPKYLVKISTYTIAFMIQVCFFIQVNGQNVLGQYTLEMEGYQGLRLQDVSGNGNLGRLVNNSKFKVETIFKPGDFPNGIVCIQKDSLVDATVAIPNILPRDKPFSVSFWIYVDPDQLVQNGIRSMNIISQSWFSISLTKSTLSDQPNSAQLSFNFPGSAGVLSDGLNKAGWYYFYVGMSEFSRFEHEAAIDIGYYYYSGNYDPSPTSIKIVRSYVFTTQKIINNQSKIYDSKFTGKMWNLKFFDKYFEYVEDVNDDKNTSWDMSKNNIKSAYTSKFYILDNMLSYYPCKYFGSTVPVLVDVKSSRSSTFATQYSFGYDRFNKPASSLSLNKNGYLTLPLFFRPYRDQLGLDPSEGYSVSFWTYIDDNISPPPFSVYPYTEEDIRYQFMNISTGGDNLAGFALIRDRFVINRYIKKNPIIPWKLWLWDKVSFQNLKGWYHIVFSQSDNATRVFMYKPNNERDSRLNYFNSQNLNELKAPTFNIGINPSQISNDNASACKSIDDIRIYGWALSEREANLLHDYESVYDSSIYNNKNNINRIKSKTRINALKNTSAKHLKINNKK